jgi:hypothetical protein
MNIFEKHKFNSLANKRNFTGLLSELVSNHYINDDPVKEYIYGLLKANRSDAIETVAQAFHSSPAAIPAHVLELIKVLANIGDETAIDILVDKFLFTSANAEINDAIQAIYKKYENPELRLRIINRAKEKFSLKIESYGGILGDNKNVGFDGLLDLLLIMNGLDMNSCDILIPKIVLHEEKVSKILIGFGPQIVKKLMPWLHYKKDKSRVQVIWHQGAYNSMEDSYGAGWKETIGDEFPIASKVKKVLGEITGMRSISTASLKTWLENHNL